MFRNGLLILLFLIVSSTLSAQDRLLSQLEIKNPGHVIIIDVDKDGDIDIIERWWNGKRVRWFDENDDMQASDVSGDLTGDCLQVDMDGDGIYDGPVDMSIKWCDNDKDGKADLQIIVINPGHDPKNLWGGSSHYMVVVDTDNDGVLGYIDWQKFDLACWRFTGNGNFSPDYHGNSLFLKAHLPPYAINDARLSWENPFAFYDTDNDGCTEMAVRLVDSPIAQDTSLYRFDGVIDDVRSSFDLDNDNGRGNELDFDMSLQFFGGKGIDYSNYKNKYPAMKAPGWVLPYFRHKNWRTIDELTFVPHAKCFDAAFAQSWGTYYFTFDEDDDDHRWERVEFYQPGDAYALCRSQAGKCSSISRHPQADSLGDRGEWDLDGSGKGKLYIGSWDNKLHLFGAESGAWTVDPNARYWGAKPVVTGGSSTKDACRVGEVVLYEDTDNDGFFDEITFDYDGDKKPELKISLSQLDNDANLQVRYQLFDPAKLKWDGLHGLFDRISNESWQDAQMLYRAVWKKGLTTPTIDDLAIASSTWEKYHNGYWLREHTFRLLDSISKGENQKQLRKAYFRGDIKEVCDLVNNIDLPLEMIRARN